MYPPNKAKAMQDIIKVSTKQESDTYLTEQNIKRIKSMFKDKQSYQYYMGVLWLLRELTEAKCQKKDEAGTKHFIQVSDMAEVYLLAAFTSNPGSLYVLRQGEKEKQLQ